MHLEDIVQSVKAVQSEERDYTMKRQLPHTLFGEPGTLTVLTTPSRSYSLNRIYHETRSRHHPAIHTTNSDGFWGEYTWITDQALPETIGSLSFFRSQNGDYFNIKANKPHERAQPRTIFSAEHLVVDNTDLYHADHGNYAPQTFKDAFKDLRSFQSRLRSIVVGANA